MFKVEARNGEVTLSEHPTLRPAIDAAMAALEDDPELGSVEVYGYIGERAVYAGQATSVPDANWNSVVGWVWAGQKVTAAAIHEALTDEEFETYITDAYADDPAKIEGMRNMREAGLC